MSGNAASLPVIVFIETAHPAIMIHRHIQMHFVARGAKLRGLRAHEGLQERAAVRLGVYAHEEVVQRAHHGIFAGGQLMQLGIFQNEITLSHGALHLHDAVAHQAAQARFGFGTIDDLLDGLVE